MEFIGKDTRPSTPGYGTAAPGYGTAAQGIGSGQPGSMDPSTVDGHTAWVTWLRGMKWDWYCTLTFGEAAEGASEALARQAANEWYNALRAAAPKAYGVIAVECGPALGGWHAHVLIGGLGAHPRWADTLRNAWRARGSVQAVRYNPALDPKNDSRRGVVPYLRKQNGDLEIVGTLKRYRPRRKGD